MKNLLTIFAIFIGVFGVAQHNLAPANTGYDWKNMSPDQRRDIINKMSPEDRMNLLNQFRLNMMVEELNLTSQEEAEFRILYEEYQEKQRVIKGKFDPNKEYDKLSDDDAKKELNHSFEVGQQLLNNRKDYSAKFMKVMRPQKVLKMYETEGMIRNKVMENQNSRGAGNKKPVRKP